MAQMIPSSEQDATERLKLVDCDGRNAPMIQSQRRKAALH